MLLSDAALAKILSEHKKQLALLELKIEKVEKEAEVDKRSADVVCKAKLDGEKAKQQACMRDLSRQQSIYRKALKDKKCPSPVWNYLSFIGGAVVSGGVCALSSRIK